MKVVAAAGSLGVKMSFSIVSVALVNRPAFTTFDYRLNLKKNQDQDKLKGARVYVPFGTAAGKEAQSLGIITAFKDYSFTESSNLKEAVLIDESCPFGSDVFTTITFASSYCHYPVGQCFFTALPLALRDGKECSFPKIDCLVLTEQSAELEASLKAQNKIRSKIQLKLLEILREHPQNLAPISVSAVKDRGITTQAINALIEKSLIRKIKTDLPALDWTISPGPGDIVREPGPALNSEQQYAVDRITKTSEFKTFLLNGITGSGKTEVYLKVIEKTLSEGKGVLVLVPEIALTPQTFERFQRRFKVPVSSMHSALSDSERFEAYLAMKFKKSGILIGTRSALFAPIPNLGLIVIDEEHDSSFKQTDGLRYHARSLAIIRARECNCPVILGSATPCLETVHNAELGIYERLDLTFRAGGAQLPEFTIADLVKEPMSQGINCGIGTTLENAIGEETVKGNQVLLFLNRRGFSRHLFCHRCGKVFICPNCDNVLTVHRMENALICHVCNHKEPLVRVCPQCNHNELLETGFGTEQVEEFLQSRYPDVPIERIDRDTVKSREELEAKLERIKSGRSCILIGTQMIAKGHDFPDVTLVGIIDIDSGIYSDDFRSLEFTAQLLTQVSGRAGRALKRGGVIIQTHHPENFLIYDLIELKRPYFDVAKHLLTMRAELKLPPFTFQAVINTNAEERDMAHHFLLNILSKIKNLPQCKDHEISPVLPDKMEKRHKRHHFHIVVTSPNRVLRRTLLDAVVKITRELGIPPGVRFAIDVDPLTIS